MKTNIGIILTLVALVLFVGMCSHKLRTASPSTPQTPAHSLSLYGAYNLLMRQDGRLFDHGPNKGRLYRLIEDKGTIVLSSNESGLFGNTFNGRIEFSPHTLRGIWTANERGAPHGGDIELTATAVGFDFKITTTAGAFVGTEPAYGQLIIQP